MTAQSNETAIRPLVGIIMGSQSDLPAMDACVQQLEAFGVPYELIIASAHRSPAKVREWAQPLQIVVLR
jgi:5-(carboxyamino)imidazole ribonucleotide mutase